MVLQALPLTVEAFDEFARLAENRDKLWEFIAGEPIEVVSNPHSSNIGARFVSVLGIYLDEHDIGYTTGADGGSMVVGERYIPDAAFITYAKQPELAYEDGYNPNPPDLAIEVLSPGNKEDDMAIKVTNYLRAGTRVWLANPPQRQVVDFVPGQPPKRLGIDDILEGGDLLPGFKLPLRKVFKGKP